MEVDFINYKQLVLSTLRGEPTNVLPFIPRLDIWYNANRKNGTLPVKYKNATQNDIRKSIDAAGRMVLTGCINNPEVLLKGSVSDVERQVAEIIENGIRLISPECAIPLKVKNENLLAVKATIVKCGRS